MIDTDFKTLLDLVTYISCIVIYKLSTWAVIFCACAKLTLNPRVCNLQRVYVVLVSLSRQQ